MEKKHMNIVIVGHVDHGKSTLIGRLFYDTGSLPDEKIKELEEASKALGRDLEFGFILDHLSEEREQGITIETTQKFFGTEKRNYTIIDAPGHVEFIKNMITGASQAEAAVLIVDAEGGVKEQTKRHAYILSMLGLKQMIVVINKMDLADYKEEKFNAIKKEILGFLNKINIHPEHIIPISAKHGDNVARKSEKMRWYKHRIVLEALDSFEVLVSKEEKPLRLPVQDIYNFDKRIIVGKMTSGKIKKEQEITILPSNESTKIKTIEMFDKELEEAMIGQSIGVTIEDKLFLDRGYIIINKKDKTPLVCNKIKAHVFWLDKEPCKKGERMLFKCSTQEVMCEIEKIEKRIDSSTLKTIEKNSDKIKDREVADVIIRTEKPVVIENFNDTPELGRFVLERKDTVAGGIITEDE